MLKAFDLVSFSQGAIVVVVIAVFTVTVAQLMHEHNKNEILRMPKVNVKA